MTCPRFLNPRPNTRLSSFALFFIRRPHYFLDLPDPPPPPPSVRTRTSRWSSDGPGASSSRCKPRRALASKSLRWRRPGRCTVMGGGGMMGGGGGGETTIQLNVSSVSSLFFFGCCFALFVGGVKTHALFEMRGRGWGVVVGGRGSLHRR